MKVAPNTCGLIAVAAALVVSGCNEARTATSAKPDGKAIANAVEVPNLIGMRYRPAQELLAKLGLRWGAIGTSYVSSKPPPDNVWSTADDDFVIEQAPNAGTEVEAGGNVLAPRFAGVRVVGGSLPSDERAVGARTAAYEPGRPLIRPPA